MKSKIQMKGLQFNKEAVTKLNDDQISQLKGPTVFLKFIPRYRIRL